MNRNEFNRFVAGIDLPGPGDLEGLRELTVLFPWFHSAHLVLLKGLRANSDIRFDSQLKASALSVNDREVLYHYLFLSPAEVSPEPENPVKEEVAAPVEEVIAPVEEESAAPVEEVIAPVEEESAPPAEEAAPAEELSAPVEEEVAAPVEEESVPAEELPAEVEEVTVPEEEMIAPVEEVIAPVEEESAPVAEETAPAEELSAPVEEESAPPAEETAPAEELPAEVEEVTVTDEEMIAPVTEGDPNARLRTREELIAEIEERLKELESYRKVIVMDQKPEATYETEAYPETIPEEASAPVAEAEPAPEESTEPLAATEPASEHVQPHEYLPEPKPEIEEAPEPEPEIEELPAPEPEIEELPAPEPEIEELPAPEPEAAPEPDLEPESIELLELLPETVAEDQHQPEKKLSPADLIDRFIMISPNIERMSPRDYQPVRDLSEEGSEEPGKFITETLAKIYVNQGYYTRAIIIYEKLTLQYPEKSAYFASRIEKIKDLIK